MKNKITCYSFFALILVFSLLAVFLPKPDFSESERRVLASAPEVSVDSIFSGKFSSDFESYSVDVFPFRDTFRGIKAFFSNNIFRKLDNNKIYSNGEHLSKLEYPLNSELLAHATERFNFIYETYLKGKAENIALSIIPDKNYFLDTLKLDYEKLVDEVQSDMEFAEYVDIFPHLSISDYYTTDSHWKQENLIPLSSLLLGAFHKTLYGEFYENTLKNPFYGVYAGQSALPHKPDTIKYLTSDIINSCIVKNYDSGSAKDALMYDLKKAEGPDPYEMFLAGSSALITVENPSITDGSHLILFRDSFGSSIAPLLASSYAKTTVVDIRYIRSDMLGNFVSDFEGADVLFLYSAAMLNSSGALR